MADFSEEDFVYIDPDHRKVIGPVEWALTGTPKAKAMPLPEEKEDAAEEAGKKRRRSSRKKRYYPWCSYRTAKRVYHVEGKEKESATNRPLNEALEKAVKETY